MAEFRCWVFFHYCLLQLVKATLAKKELQETFLEFDLLGVVKRWLQVRVVKKMLRGAHTERTNGSVDVRKFPNKPFS